MKIEIGKEKFISIVILVITAVLLYSLFMTPQGRQIKAVRSQYISGKELLMARKAKGEELETLRNRNREWKYELDTIQNRFLNKGEINSFLKSLTRLAEETRNKLKTIEPLARKSPPELGIEKMFVKVTVVGRYASIINFLNKLATNEKLLSVSDVRIQKEKGEGRDLKISFVLTLFVIEAET